MLHLALDICKDKGFTNVEIVPYENNKGAVKTILYNGGKLKEKFYDNGKTLLRFEIDLLSQYIMRPFTKNDINFIYNLMSEENNLFALHTDVISLEEWQNVFAQPQDTDEENFIVYKNDIPCAWLKLNGLQNKNIAWILRFDDILSSALELGELKNKDFELSEETKAKISDFTNAPSTAYALETLIKYYYANRQEDTDWVVLPVANFDAYFGSTSFSKKRLTELVKSGAIERENSYNVSRYRLNEVFK